MKTPFSYFTFVSLYIITQYSAPALAKMPKILGMVPAPVVKSVVDPIAEIANEANKRDDFTAQAILSSVPDGAHNHPISPDCEPRRLEERILREAKSNSDVFKLYKSYFTNCAEELGYGSAKGLLGLGKFALAKYEFFKHPQVSRVNIVLDDGTIIPSILALKKDGQARPFIVVQCGVFCSAEESSSTKNYMMALFDESPFNVLILSSRSGMDFIESNHIMSLAGQAEAAQNMMLGKWLLEQAPFKNKISSLHYMGISLGGNSAMMEPLLNEDFKKRTGKFLFNSVTAICPVIDLESTLKNLVDSLVVGDIMYFMTKDHVLKAQKHLKDIPDLISKQNFPEKKELADKLAEWTAESLTRRGLATTRDEFWQQQNFFNFYRRTETPTLVWASRDDIVVKNKPNAGRLEKSLMLNFHRNMGVMNLDYGNHCGFSSVYGNPMTASILRSFVMFNSPEYKNEYKRFKQPATLPSPKIARHQTHLLQKWKFKANSDKVKLRYDVFNPSGDSSCADDVTGYANPQCVNTYEYNVKVSELQNYGAYIPETEVEAESLTRDFNARLELWAGSNILNGKNAAPSHIVWRGR